MAFRSNEAKEMGYEAAKRYLIPKNITGEERQRSEEALEDIVHRYGCAVEHYPSWHPLVSKHEYSNPVTWPSRDCGYLGLDHTRAFQNAFVTCPYDDGQDIIDSVNSLPYTGIALIEAERLDVQFYQPEAKPVLVTCKWNKDFNSMFDETIPASIAVPLLLEQELDGWKEAQRGETWETMRPYFLGEPHGRRSSVFVSQDTALTMKKIWNLLIYTGAFGPIKVSNQS